MDSTFSHLYYNASTLFVNEKIDTIFWRDVRWIPQDNTTELLKKREIQKRGIALLRGVKTFRKEQVSLVKSPERGYDREKKQRSIYLCVLMSDC